MRPVLALVVTLLVATAVLADDATLMLRKSGSCSGVVTAVDRGTRRTIASCGFGCTERAAQVPVGTRVSVTTQAYGQCAGGIDLTQSSAVVARRAFVMDAGGVVITARFRMVSHWIPSAFPTH